MTTVALQRCFHHASRGASARCPECRRFYCRECVTEHRGRVLCTRCLEQRARKAARRSARGALALYLASGLVNLLVLVTLFYATGSLLASLPSSFHDGAVFIPEREE